MLRLGWPGPRRALARGRDLAPTVVAARPGEDDHLHAGRTTEVLLRDGPAGHPAFSGIPVGEFLGASRAAELDWDPERKTGAVYYLVRSLELKGEIGVTAIGDPPDQANEIDLAVARILDGLAGAVSATAP